MYGLIKALFFSSGPKYSWKKVTVILLFTIALVNGTIFLGYAVSVGLLAVPEGEEIQAIVQVHAQLEDGNTELPTAYFAEVLGLSVDHPQKIGFFNLEEAKSRLLDTYVIKEAKLKKIKPNTLQIEYATRKPLALIGDNTNMAICSDGLVFPYLPFFSPRKLPILFLGEPGIEWGQKIKEDMIKFLHEIFTLCQNERIAELDLSQINASSAGRREIILTLSNGDILRLNVKNYPQQLPHYFYLKKNLFKEKGRMLVDLRIDQIAYLKTFVTEH
jgi:cell division septal protein FtsQ